MSKVQQTEFEGLGRIISPNKKITEPTLWFREIRLLKSWSVSKTEQIRAIELHRGLNILWAKAEDPSATTRLYNDGLSGHATGKTLFCRMIRFLLGEEHYGPKELRDSVEGSFLNLWVVAHVRLEAQSWILGRPVTGPGAHFAVRGDSIKMMLEQEAAPTDSFSIFKALLQEATCSSIIKQYPIDPWRHLLPWLARDQEARFSNVAAWRVSESGGDNPRKTVAEQHLLMRAILGLLDPQENMIRDKLELLVDETKRKTDREPEENRCLVKDVERFRKIMETSVLKEHIDRDDFDELLRVIQAHRIGREELIEKLLNNPDPEEVMIARDAKFAKEKAVMTIKAEILAETTSITQLEEQRNQSMAFIDKIRKKGIIDSHRASEGMCPRTLLYAQTNGYGCAASPAEGVADVEELSRQAGVLSHKITLLKDAKACKESSVERLEREEREAALQYEKIYNEHAKDVIRFGQDVEQLRTCESRIKDVIESKKIHDATTMAIKDVEPKKDELRTQLLYHRNLQNTARCQLSEIFFDILKAVMGEKLDKAEIKLTEEGLKPHAERKAPLRGAAIETVKTVAFDLAAVVSSMEGNGYHPRFLIHDGPREGDMALIIYEHFFNYAVRMEQACRNANIEPTFQYIITTTTNPPKNMQKVSDWLLEPVLNSSDKDGRLLKEDF